jgi:hypothetical protein
MLRHLVTVWNPAYARDVMGEHLRVLRHWARLSAEGAADEEEVFVWWGKVRSPNRQQPLARRADAVALNDQADESETQLYLTDYRSLYVGEVLEVHDGDLPADELDHTPHYYREHDLRGDLWFMLGDIRRLVQDDTVAVVEELKKLRNVHYNDRPVSIYGGMVDLPLIVTRPDGAQFFDRGEQDALLGDRLWAEFDAEDGAGTAELERDLRDNRFGEALWRRLGPASRTFVATGERLYRDHRGDVAFDFAPVLTSFAKAIETETNALLRAALRRLPPPARLANVQGQTVELGEIRFLSLGELARVIGGERELNEGLRGIVENGPWLCDSFPHVLGELAQVRNQGAHAAIIDRATATHWRNRLVGVGCEGELVRLARTRLR